MEQPNLAYREPAEGAEETHSRLGEVFDIPTITDKIFNNVTNQRDKVNLRLVCRAWSAFGRRRTANLTTHRLSFGARALEQPLADAVEPSRLLQVSKHREQASQPGFYVNERRLRTSDPAVLVEYFKQLLSMCTPLTHMNVIMSHTTLPLYLPSSMRSIGWAKELRAEMVATDPRIGDQVQGINGNDNGFSTKQSEDENETMALLCLLMAVKETKTFSVQHLYIHMSRMQARAYLSNSVAMTFMKYMPKSCVHLSLTYPMTYTRVQLPSLQHMQQLHSFHVVMRQTATIMLIADGGENGIRQELKNWFQSELSENGRKIKDFGIRALPIAGGDNMPTAWNHMDDVLDITDFVDNCSAEMQSIHIQTKLSLKDLHTELNRDPNRLVKLFTPLRHFALLCMADQMNPEALGDGINTATDMLTARVSPNLRQFVWITYAALKHADCKKLASTFLDSFVDKPRIAGCPPVLALRFGDVIKTAKDLKRAGLIKMYRIVSQSHVIVWWIPRGPGGVDLDKESVRKSIGKRTAGDRLMHLIHAVRHEKVKRKGAQSLADLHSVKRHCNGQFADHFGLDIYDPTPK